MKLVALTQKLESYESTSDPITLNAIVSLLECLQHFPEFAERTDVLMDYHIKAKCQVRTLLGVAIVSKKCMGQSSSDCNDHKCYYREQSV